MCVCPIVIVVSSSSSSSSLLHLLYSSFSTCEIAHIHERTFPIRRRECAVSPTGMRLYVQCVYMHAHVRVCIRV